MSYADQLRRLQVAAATGRLPADLGAWALRELSRHNDARREARDRLLAEAARALLPDGSVWARATALAHEIGRTRTHELVAAALDIDPDTPRSVRQLARILTSTLSTCQSTP